MLLLSNSRQKGLANGDHLLQGSYAACMNASETGLCGVATHYQHGFLILQLPPNETGDQFHATWELALADSKRKIRGVIGQPEQVNAVLEKLSPAASDIQSNSVETLYRVTPEELTMPATESAHTFRKVTTTDIPLLGDWMANYEEELVGTRDSPEERQR